jgi:hypothetical protein
MTHKKRPRDPAQLVKLMIDIASGEVEDRGVSKRAKPLGRGWTKPSGAAQFAFVLFVLFVRFTRARGGAERRAESGATSFALRSNPI